jgi:hypothetical protein
LSSMSSSGSAYLARLAVNTTCSINKQAGISHLPDADTAAAAVR